MHIQIIGTANRLPHWSDAAFKEYQKRINPPHRLDYTTIKSVGARHAHKPEYIAQDGDKLLDAVKTIFVSCSMVTEKCSSSEQLAEKLELWQQHDKISILIGGACGHSQKVKAHADFTLSLGLMTLNHPFVFALMAEQIYRSFCIIHQHPYHK